LLGKNGSKAARAYTTHNIIIPARTHYALDVEVSPEDSVLRFFLGFGFEAQTLIIVLIDLVELQILMSPSRQRPAKQHPMLK